jgi:hypothetical protein
MKTTSPVLHSALLAAGLFAASNASAGTIILSATAPSTDLLVSSTTADGTPDGFRDYTDNNLPLGVGQSFTVDSTSTLSAFTLLGAGGSGNNSPGNPVSLTLSLGTVTDGVFTSSYTDTATLAESEVNSNGTDGDYISFTLSVPQALSPGVTYAAFLSTPAAYIGIDVASSDAFAGGSALTGGTTQTYDRVFFVQGTAVPEPSSILLGLVSGVGMLGLRRRRA